jgi:hypothetical protein
MKTVWDIAQAMVYTDSFPANDDTIIRLLSDGWEPFAVTKEFAGSVYHLRRGRVV